ncbi:hypothetical protein BMW24_022385 [Mycobacterium heckeshornense]|uniref:Uncharacterized protein n=1 Tax=Mycobacterium heckeshornense TaxID=110505 RepID=A0A2G8AX25_9MYCO|nr:hypothetical protein BMW24_022385 [Mycobacterium heckeshornense]BCO35491.1 hypothetical protein MHEC_19240 [Mycobacterium heckeshornense]BCQ08650.1 putative protein [Mycobacterium heckeshornense]
MLWSSSIVPHPGRPGTHGRNPAGQISANSEPVTSRSVLIGRHAHTSRESTGPATGGRVARRARLGALALGSLAAVAMGIVGCTSITDGTPTADTAIAPAYRASVSASVSASSATSRIRESQRQQSLTTKAVRAACESLATTSKDAIDKVNAFVGAFNQGRDTAPTEGPAIDALNNTADTVAASVSTALSQELRERLNGYVEAARGVANAIASHAPTGEFNRRVDQLNDTKTKALKLCLASF